MWPWADTALHNAHHIASLPPAAEWERSFRSRGRRTTFVDVLHRAPQFQPLRSAASAKPSRKNATSEIGRGLAPSLHNVRSWFAKFPIGRDFNPRDEHGDASGFRRSTPSSGVEMHDLRIPGEVL